MPLLLAAADAHAVVMVAAPRAAADIVCRHDEAHCNRLIHDSPPGKSCSEVTDEVHLQSFDETR